MADSLERLTAEIVRCAPLPAPGRVAGGRRRPTRRAATGARSTGRGRCPASATRERGSCSSGWRPRPTAPTGPGGCSPATARATGSTRRCTGRVSRTRPRSEHRDDGLRLARRLHHRRQPLRRRPPTSPTPAERDNCLPFLVAELALLERARVIVALGSFAWDGRAARAAGARRPESRARSPASGTAPRRSSGRYTLIGCYHPSQQNTFTGKLTEPMLDAVVRPGDATAPVHRVGRSPRRG